MEERSRSPRSGWTLFQCGGSAVLRALPYTLLATLLSALLHFPLESKVNFLRQEWQDPYPFNAFVLVLALIVLLRVCVAHLRFWEGQTLLRTLASKLAGVAHMAIHTDEARCEDEVAAVARMHAHHVQGSTADRAADIVKDHWQFKVLVMHLISLMHGVALARLRRDFKISNLEAHESGCVVGTESTRQAATSLHAAHQSATANVVTPAETPSAPLAGGLSCFSDDCNLMLPKTRPGSSDEIHTGSRAHRQATINACNKIPILYDVSEWEGNFLAGPVTDDSISPKMNRKRPERTRSSGFRSARESDTSSSSGRALASRLSVPLRQQALMHGLEESSWGCYLPAPADRVHTVHAWLLQHLLRRLRHSSMHSCMHGTLSEVMAAYEQKLVDTQLPFPWHHACSFLLLMLTVAFPFMALCFIQQPVISIVLTALTIQAFAMMHEVAACMEEPFRTPELAPFRRLQFVFNERLLGLGNAPRPSSLADDVVTVDARGNITVAAASAQHMWPDAEPTPYDASAPGPPPPRQQPMHDPNATNVHTRGSPYTLDRTEGNDAILPGGSGGRMPRLHVPPSGGVPTGVTGSPEDNQRTALLQRTQEAQQYFSGKDLPRLKPLFTHPASHNRAYEPNNPSADVVRSTLRQRRTAWSKGEVFRRDGTGLQHFKNMLVAAAVHAAAGQYEPHGGLRDAPGAGVAPVLEEENADVAASQAAVASVQLAVGPKRHQSGSARRMASSHPEETSSGSSANLGLSPRASAAGHRALEPVQEEQSCPASGTAAPAQYSTFGCEPTFMPPSLKDRERQGSSSPIALTRSDPGSAASGSIRAHSPRSTKHITCTGDDISRSSSSKFRDSRAPGGSAGGAVHVAAAGAGADMWLPPPRLPPPPPATVQREISGGAVAGAVAGMAGGATLMGYSRTATGASKVRGANVGYEPAASGGGVEASDMGQGETVSSVRHWLGSVTPGTYGQPQSQEDRHGSPGHNVPHRSQPPRHAPQALAAPQAQLAQHGASQAAAGHDGQSVTTAQGDVTVSEHDGARQRVQGRAGRLREARTPADSIAAEYISGKNKAGDLDIHAERSGTGSRGADGAKCRVSPDTHYVAPSEDGEKAEVATFVVEDPSGHDGGGDVGLGGVGGAGGGVEGRGGSARRRSGSDAAVTTGTVGGLSSSGHHSSKYSSERTNKYDSRQTGAIEGQVFPELPLRGTSPRPRSPSPFSDTSSVPDTLKGMCQSVFANAQALYDEQARERRARRARRLGTPVDTPKPNAESAEALPGPERADAVSNSSGRGRGRSGSSRMFETTSGEIILTPANAATMQSTAAHVDLESPPSRAARVAHAQRPHSSRTKRDRGAISPSQDISRRKPEPGAPEIDLKPRQQPSPRPSDRQSFFTEQLYDLHSSSITDHPSQASREVWEMPPSPSGKSSGPSTAPSLSPASRSPAGRGATVRPPSNTKIREVKQEASGASAQRVREPTWGSSGCSGQDRSIGAVPQRGQPIADSSAMAKSSTFSQAARVSDDVIAPKEASSGGRKSTFVVKRQSGHGGHPSCSSTAAESARSEVVDPRSVSRPCESIREAPGSEFADVGQGVPQAQQHVSITDGGGTSAAESAETHMHAAGSSQRAPFERSEASWTRRRHVHHDTEPSMEASTDHSVSASVATAASHQRSQVSTKTRASSSSAAHPATPAQHPQHPLHARPFLQPPRHDDVAPVVEDPDLVSVVEEGQLEEAEQWCRSPTMEGGSGSRSWTRHRWNAASASPTLGSRQDTFTGGSRSPEGHKRTHFWPLSSLRHYAEGDAADGLGGASSDGVLRSVRGRSAGGGIRSLGGSSSGAGGVRSLGGSSGGAGSAHPSGATGSSTVSSRGRRRKRRDPTTYVPHSNGDSPGGGGNGGGRGGPSGASGAGAGAGAAAVAVASITSPGRAQDKGPVAGQPFNAQMAVAHAAAARQAAGMRLAHKGASASGGGRGNRGASSSAGAPSCSGSAPGDDSGATAAQLLGRGGSRRRSAGRGTGDLGGLARGGEEVAQLTEPREGEQVDGTDQPRVPAPASRAFAQHHASAARREDSFQGFSHAAVEPGLGTDGGLSGAAPQQMQRRSYHGQRDARTWEGASSSLHESSSITEGARRWTAALGRDTAYQSDQGSFMHHPTGTRRGSGVYSQAHPGHRGPAITPLYTHAPPPVRVPRRPPGDGAIVRPGEAGRRGAEGGDASDVSQPRNPRGRGPSPLYSEQGNAASQLPLSGSVNFVVDPFEDAEALGRLVPLNSTLNPVTPTESTQSSVRRYSPSPGPPGGSQGSRSRSARSGHSMHARGRGHSAPRVGPQNAPASPPPTAGSGLRLGPGGRELSLPNLPEVYSTRPRSTHALQGDAAYAAHLAQGGGRSGNGAPGHGGVASRSPGRSPGHSSGRSLFREQRSTRASGFGSGGRVLAARYRHYRESGTYTEVAPPAPRQPLPHLHWNAGGEQFYSEPLVVSDASGSFLGAGVQAHVGAQAAASTSAGAAASPDMHGSLYWDTEQVAPDAEMAATGVPSGEMAGGSSQVVGTAAQGGVEAATGGLVPGSEEGSEDARGRIIRTEARDFFKNQ